MNHSVPTRSESTLPNSNSRRKFVTRALATGVGLAAFGTFGASRAMAAAPPLTFANIPGTGDVKVVNFALALEDLEADLYVQAVMRLTTGGVNQLGIHIPGLGIAASAADVDYLKEFGIVEKQHRDLLRGTLGAQAIKPFKYNFGMETLTRQQVDTLVYTAERTGVSAYLGAIPYFATRNYLQLAGAIEGTEARHTAVIAQVIDNLFQLNIHVAPSPVRFNAIDQPAPPDTVLAEVSPFIVTNP